MRKQVVKKQYNSRMCLVCGLRNDLGLKSAFYELDSGELLAVFSPRAEHQSYPGRLHGGISSTILDETIGRAIMINHPGQFGVTVEISLKFKKPVPLEQELRVVARITSENSRFFEGTGELLLADGTVAVTGRGRYLKMELAKIADFAPDEQDWQVVSSAADPVSVEF
ncbi:MAG: PaaI family thioesterase [Desulfobulbaceae bacterium]|nr:PaaI family thioesterase [Desulfobulbaceae bacterium]